MAHASKKTTAQPAKPPVVTLKDGLVFVKIWEHAGNNGNFHTVTTERRYRNRNEEWASTRNLRQDDLLPAAELLRQAYKEINRLRRTLRNEE